MRPERRFQHTAARRRLRAGRKHVIKPKRFNTQPPEGGCSATAPCRRISAAFQHTAARRRLPGRGRQRGLQRHVSTHSRPKAAAQPFLQFGREFVVSTHSRPKAAARVGCDVCVVVKVSTHSRPKAAASPRGLPSKSFSTFQHTAARRRLHRPWPARQSQIQFQHTAARRRLPVLVRRPCASRSFQHTAARRRLHPGRWRLAAAPLVSTHSRPKAAACNGFDNHFRDCQFQHTAARRRLLLLMWPPGRAPGFQHTAARRRLLPA